MSLTTLARVKAELKANVTAAADDALLMTYIRQISDRIEDQSWQFQPLLQTITLDETYHVNSRRGTLYTERPIVRLIEVSRGTTAVASTNVSLYPAGTFPAFEIFLSRALNWYTLPGDFRDMIKVTGWFAWRENYDREGWIASGDALTAGVNDTVSVIPVTLPSGADSRGYAPRFSPGNLILVGDEMMEIMTITGTNLSVQRGARRTVPVAHLSGAAISVWYPEPTIERAATRQVASWYGRRGAYEQIGGGLGSSSYPTDLLQEVYGAMQRFNNRGTL